MKKLTYSQKKMICFFAGIILMILCSGVTSPLYPHYTGLDSSVFLTMAKGITKGKVPYIDLFDHKGPVFYWMETVGYLAGGRTGVCCFQCVLLMLDLYFIDRISSLFHADFLTAGIPFLSAFFFLFEHGNLTEEFSIPLLLAGFYFELRFLLSENENHSPRAAFLYGVIFGLIAFIRLNNAIPFCALLLCIIIILIQKGQWKNLLYNLLCGILGLAAAAMPICLYYYRHNALYDMLYGTFLHNLIYAKQNTHYPVLSSRFLFYMVLFAPGVYAFIIYLMKWKRDKDRAYLSLLFATAVTYAMLAYTNVYTHYYMLGLPLFAAASAAAGSDCSVSDFLTKIRTYLFGKVDRRHQTRGAAATALLLIAVVYMALSGLSACAPIYKTYLTDIAYDEYSQIQTGIAVIPEEDRDSVIAYDLLANYYFHADILPCYKYFTLQRWLTTEKVNVRQEFMHYLSEGHPLWVVVPATERDAAIKDILASDYSCRLSDGIYTYYRYLGTEQ